MKPEFIRERFPYIYKSCLAQGVDITRELLPVVPAAHFSCGGVHTDLQGRTNVRHLNAIGETGLHRPARRQPAREHLAARMPREREICGPADRPRSARRAGAFRLPDPRTWQSPAREADPLLIRQDMQQIQQTRCGTTPASCARRAAGRARRILLRAARGDSEPSTATAGSPAN
jgi:L-aspartate oxidase